jgi:hypothetical protein
MLFEFGIKPDGIIHCLSSDPPFGSGEAKDTARLAAWRLINEYIRNSSRLPPEDKLYSVKKTQKQKSKGRSKNSCPARLLCCLLFALSSFAVYLVVFPVP